MGLGDCAERPLGSLLLQRQPRLCPTLDRLLMYPADIKSSNMQQRVMISILKPTALQWQTNRAEILPSAQAC